MIVVDKSGFVVSFNPAAEATFGYTQTYAVGKLMADLIVPPERRQAHAASLQRYRDRRGTMARSACRDASDAFGWHYISGGTGSICEVDCRSVACSATYLRDLTPRKEAEAEMQETTRRAA